MADENLLQIIRQGVDAWNDWRGKNLERLDLSGTDLSGTKVTADQVRSASTYAGAQLPLADAAELGEQPAESPPLQPTAPAAS